MAETIKMRREEPEREGAPVEADVHPDEVKNWEAHGWRVVEDLSASADPLKTPRGRPKKD